MIRTRAFQRRQQQAHAIRRRFARARFNFIKYGGHNNNVSLQRARKAKSAFYANDWHYQKQSKERRDAFILQNPIEKDFLKNELKRMEESIKNDSS